MFSNLLPALLRNSHQEHAACLRLRLSASRSLAGHAICRSACRDALKLRIFAGREVVTHNRSTDVSRRAEIDSAIEITTLVLRRDRALCGLGQRRRISVLRALRERCRGKNANGQDKKG